MEVEELDKIKRVYHNNNMRLSPLSVENVHDILCHVDDDFYVLIEFECGAIYSDFVTDSWRGSYGLPAIFATEEPHKVKWCRDNLSLTDGKQVTGYKGGDYTLSEMSELFVEEYDGGSTAHAIVDYKVFDGYVVMKTQANAY